MHAFLLKLIAVTDDCTAGNSEKAREDFQYDLLTRAEKRSATAQSELGGLASVSDRHCCR